jgi:hypothetical protein
VREECRWERSYPFQPADKGDHRHREDHYPYDYQEITHIVMVRASAVTVR